ncbi:MAG: hypothetical protein IJM37_12025 [Lachnospiraceae bacterium]|nr:hypothetical protein [Lachnospiraceae bacterium]
MKRDVFDIHKFDKYKEDNRREVKAAEGGLPINLWDMYSYMILMVKSLKITMIL